MIEIEQKKNKSKIPNSKYTDIIKILKRYG